MVVIGLNGSKMTAYEGCRRYKNVLLEKKQKVNHEAGVTAIMDGRGYRKTD